MNEHEFDLVARAWLDDGPSRMSDHALLSALEEIHATRQRRTGWPAWRAPRVSRFAALGAVAAVVVAVALLASTVIPRQPGGPSVGGHPSPTSTPDPTPSPSPTPASSRALDVPLTSTFVSPINGFAFGYLDRGGLQPATERWDPGSEPPVSETAWPIVPPRDKGFDLVETGLGALFKAASTEIPDGVAVDDWIDAAVASRASTPTCMAPRGRQAEITIDGQPGRISEGCAHQFIATVVVDGRLDVFILLHGREEADARALFDRWIATIDLHPQAAPAVAPSS